jgi:hypothetical protein
MLKHKKMFMCGHGLHMTILQQERQTKGHRGVASGKLTPEANCDDRNSLSAQGTAPAQPSRSKVSGEGKKSRVITVPRIKGQLSQSAYQLADYCSSFPFQLR